LITPIPPDSAKYRSESDVDLSNIEDVDRVWKREPLETLLHNKLDTFDAIIPSHVIEHFVDPIGFFNSASRLLKEDGRIALAVPDNACASTACAPVSTTDQLITTWRSKRRLHSLASVFDHSAYHARRQRLSRKTSRRIFELGTRRSL
jgi:2-polyprenyl-3-methyl-5-hydroxy-6-metoxy-1,4-benzoquinol methylase